MKVIKKKRTLELLSVEQARLDDRIKVNKEIIASKASMAQKAVANGIIQQCKTRLAVVNVDITCVQREVDNLYNTYPKLKGK